MLLVVKLLLERCMPASGACARAAEAPPLPCVCVSRASLELRARILGGAQAARSCVAGVANNCAWRGWFAFQCCVALSSRTASLRRTTHACNLACSCCTAGFSLGCSLRLVSLLTPPDLPCSLESGPAFIVHCLPCFLALRSCLLRFSVLLCCAFVCCMRRCVERSSVSALLFRAAACACLCCALPKGG